MASQVGDPAMRAVVKHADSWRCARFNGKLVIDTEEFMVENLVHMDGVRRDGHSVVFSGRKSKSMRHHIISWHLQLKCS